MSRMFGERLNEFVLSIGIMDEDTFKDIMNLIWVYVNRHLNVTYLSILREATVDNRPGLQSIWSSRDEGKSYTVEKEKTYASHSAYTYGENKPLWVVSDSEEELRTAKIIVNLWGDNGVRTKEDALPRYETAYDDSVRTSVMHPLRHEDRAIGVIEFAAEKYVEPTPASLEEVQTLATIVSRAFRMYDIRRKQRENAKQALQMIEHSLTASSWKRLALPQIFVAFPKGAQSNTSARREHDNIIKIMKNTVSEFSNIMSPKYWDESNEAGDINDQVIRDIVESEYGITYLSEPIPKGRFRDNANVLFEAGMMQALKKSPNALLKAWIPIRENSPESIPFDIAAERILFVNRSDRGKFDEAAFVEGLRNRLKDIIQINKALD